MTTPARFEWDNAKDVWFVVKPLLLGMLWFTASRCSEATRGNLEKRLPRGFFGTTIGNEFHETLESAKLSDEMPSALHLSMLVVAHVLCKTQSQGDSKAAMRKQA